MVLEAGPEISVDVLPECPVFPSGGGDQYCSFPILVTLVVVLGNDKLFGDWLHLLSLSFICRTIYTELSSSDRDRVKAPQYVLSLFHLIFDLI